METSTARKQAAISDQYRTPGYRRILGVAGLLSMCGVLLSGLPATAQQEDVAAPQITAGVFVAPPFMMKTSTGRWEGLSIELWRELAHALDVEFEWRELTSLAEIRDALARGEIDVVPGLGITEENEVIMDFSHPYYRSGSAIAVSATNTPRGWLGTLRGLLFVDILRILALLVLLWIGAGAALWLCERRRNHQMSADGPRKAIEHSIWWAVVTMTTVGYGDIAPKTLPGRVFAVVWMLVSIVLIASLTATITTNLTVGALHGGIRGLHDLSGVRVGSVAESESTVFLGQHGIEALPSANSRDGLQAIADNELDAFVFNAAILSFLAQTEFPGRVKVLPGIFDPYYIAVATRSSSALREPIDRALLKIVEQETWPRWMARYISSDSQN